MYQCVNLLTKTDGRLVPFDNNDGPSVAPDNVSPTIHCLHCINLTQTCKQEYASMLGQIERTRLPGAVS